MKRYRTPRIQASLAQRQLKLSLRTVSKIMKYEGLKAIQPRSFVAKKCKPKMHHVKIIIPFAVLTRKLIQCLKIIS
jgi:hypothetical protein